MRQSGRNWLVLAIAMVALSGCGAGGVGDGGLTFGSIGKPPETVAVAGRSVVIGGAPGYCVDRTASRLGGESPFVLLGSCASISGNRKAVAPDRQGILTATVSAPGGGPEFAEILPDLERFLASNAGRAGLARDGNARSVKVLSTQREDGALFIHLRDASTNNVPEVGATYWRGLFQVKGRLVTVSVMEFQARPMGSDASLRTLRSFVARIRRETAAI